MKKGDILEIKGALGFEFNPTKQVIEIKGDMVLLDCYPAKEGGLLSHMNQTWYGIDFIEKKLTPLTRKHKQQVR